MTAASRLGNELLAFKNTLGTSLIIATRIITDICSGNRISHERILRTGYLIRREGMARRVTHFALIAGRAYLNIHRRHGDSSKEGKYHYGTKDER